MAAAELQSEVKSLRYVIYAGDGEMPAGMLRDWKVIFPFERAR